MADPSSADPAAAWRQLVAQWEQGVNALANQAMGSEEFAKSLHKASGMSLGIQQALGDLMGRYLASLNLPSRAEMIGIGDRLQAIEATLARLEIKLDRMAGERRQPDPAAAARPPRTKRPQQTAAKP